MGIDRGAAAGHAGVVAAQRTGAGKAAGQAAGQAAGGGDFLALMAALGDGLGLGLGLGAGPGVEQSPADAPATDEALPSRRRGRDEPATGVVDPAGVGAAALQAMPVDAVASAAQGGSGAAPPGAAGVGAGASAGDGAGRAVGGGGAAEAAAGAHAVRARPAGLAAEQAAGAVAADVQAPPQARDAMAHEGAAAPVLASTAQPSAAPAASAVAPAGDPRLAPQYASVFEQLQQHLAARTAGALEPASRAAESAVQAGGVRAATGAGAATGASGGATRELRDAPRAERGATALSALSAGNRAETQAAVAAQASVAAGDAGPRNGGQDAAGSGAGDTRALHGAAAGWIGADFTPTVAYDAALTGLEGAPQPEAMLERQLADQLRQWASQGVRSAELTVGTTEPVQVRIALDGHEAQVQFRAEHAATRDMLAASVDQLRELLGAEGLVLSGVSVGGHSAGGDPGQAGDGPRARTAPTRVTAAHGEPVGDAPAASPRPATGALDLYV